jgi:hypothetical protein
VWNKLESCSIEARPAEPRQNQRRQHNSSAAAPTETKINFRLAENAGHHSFCLKTRYFGVIRGLPVIHAQEDTLTRQLWWDSIRRRVPGFS